MTETRAYRFGDSDRPGLLLGLSARQSAPIAVAVLTFALLLQANCPVGVAFLVPVAGVVVAFGRWRHAPLTDLLVPGTALLLHQLTLRLRPSSSREPGVDCEAPVALRGLEVRHCARTGFAVIHDTVRGTVTGVVRVYTHGFPFASATEQHALLDAWSATLAPFGREGSPVSQIVWQETTRPADRVAHRAFLESTDIAERAAEPAVSDYLALVEHQTARELAHEVLISLSIDLRRIRRRQLHDADEVLAEELRVLQLRLESAGITVEPPMTAVEVTACLQVRSEPFADQNRPARRPSLALASRRTVPSWYPAPIEERWAHVRVGTALHRTFHVARWPGLPVGADWLGALLTDADLVRTVTVVLEPVPTRLAARAAGRELVARESDADAKEQRGFRVNARERRRFSDVEARERELAEGHTEFRFAGLITVTSDGQDQLERDCRTVEQAAAQSLLELRPMDARHARGWVASLPIGRVLARTATT
jgi:hypothetical protein